MLVTIRDGTWNVLNMQHMSDFKVKFDLEDQGQLTIRLAGILTNVSFVFCPSLVVLA